MYLHFGGSVLQETTALAMEVAMGVAKMTTPAATMGSMEMAQLAVVEAVQATAVTSLRTMVDHTEAAGSLETAEKLETADNLATADNQVAAGKMGTAPITKTIAGPKQG